MSRNQCLLRYGWCSCDLYSKCSLCFPCISAQLSAVQHRKFLGSLKPPDSHSPFVAVSYWSALNVPKSLGVSKAKNFRELRSGDHAGQLAGPLHPIRCSPKVWFRCCMTVWRKWGGAPSCMTHMCFHWWRGICSKNTGKAFTIKNDGHYTC
jgi:hypothetical protein